MSFLAHEENGLLIKTSTVLSDVRHGFSTRIGGVSPAPWDSLNLGVGRGDDMDRVRENYRRFCAALGVETVVHDYPGRNDTVRLGLEAVGEVERCLFCPADQPLLRRQTVESLLLCGQNSRGRIWRPCFRGAPGAPILFSRDYFDELKHLPQGKGGGVVAASHGESVRTLPVADRRELWDIDTPENLTELEQTMK